jgi:hypothetical protein
MKKPKKPTATAPISEPAAFAVTEEAIRERAYELYEQRGRLDGHAVEDWLAALSIYLPKQSAHRERAGTVHGEPDSRRISRDYNALARGMIGEHHPSPSRWRRIGLAHCAERSWRPGLPPARINGSGSSDRLRNARLCHFFFHLSEDSLA